MSEKIPVLRKVLAYITHGSKLLVFEHRDYDAGVQVPAGTLDEGESPELGVLREAFEETGLEGLRIVSYLGETLFDRRPYGTNQLHRRHFFHLTTDAPVPETWQHAETDPSEGDADEIWFCLYWVDLPDGVPELVAEHGAMLAALPPSG